MLKILKHMNKKDWQLAGLSFIFIIVQIWLDLKLPDYMAEITRLVQTEGSAMSDILWAGGYMLLCALGSLVATFIVGYFVAKIAAGLSMRLRDLVFNKTISFSMEEINAFSTSSLINRSTNDITQIQAFVSMGFQAIVKAPILAVWAIMKILDKSWQWTAATSVAVILLIILLAVIIVFAIPKFNVIQELNDNINRVSRENLSGIRVVYAYNAQSYQTEKFEQENQAMTKTNLFTNRLMAILSPGMSLIMALLTLSIYIIGAGLINQAVGMDRLTLFSDMVVFSSYAMQIIMAFMMVCFSFIILPRASVSARRIQEVLSTETKIVDGPGVASELFEQGEIEFKNVSFKYPDADEYILHDVSFKARKGETVAFIGSTGSGKSTLINLIPRFYDATEGEVLIDGVNVKAYTQEQLRNKIGYVSQKAVLFGGSIESNIMYGENGRTAGGYDAMVEAVEIAQAKSFVESKDDQYQAHVAQGGTNLSGGQKQRVSFARAIYRNPEFYVFDDSFSALDYKTDKTLRAALKAKTSNVTTLIVAQRISTIIDADQIIVLEDGKLVGQGKHDALLESCQVYREIAESQLSKEEVYHV